LNDWSASAHSVNTLNAVQFISLAQIRAAPIYIAQMRH